jgi:hypothetical protein
MEVVMARLDGKVVIARKAQDQTGEWPLHHQQGEQYPHQSGKALFYPAHYTGLHVCSFLHHT